MILQKSSEYTDFMLKKHLLLSLLKKQTNVLLNNFVESVIYFFQDFW